jgi:hypothetical protein
MQALRAASAAFVAGLLVAACGGGPAPKKECTPSTCQGCCDESGECLAGTALFACGAGGESCVACEANQVCTMGGCGLIAGGDYDASFPDRPDASVRYDAGVFMPGDAGATMDAGTMDAGPMMVSYSAQVQPIFDSRCDACHAWTYDTVVNVNGRITPGNLTASAIYQRCLSGDMPRNAGMLTQTQLNLIRDWILSGAPRN